MKYSKNAFLLALALGASASQAAAVDVTAIVTDITAQLVPIGLVAASVLGLHVAVKTYQWIRRALA